MNIEKSFGYFRKWKKESTPTDVWFHKNPHLLPSFPLLGLSDKVFAAYSGPDSGLNFVKKLEISDKKDSDEEGLLKNDKKKEKGSVLVKWNLKNRKAYGISMSLYDQHPISGKITGDPVADCFGLCGRENSCVMVVADGVNWGENSRLAARCAVYGAMTHINSVFLDHPPSSTREVFNLLMDALHKAHHKIIQHDGGFTTLCLCLVCPILDDSYNSSSLFIPSSSPLSPSSVFPPTFNSSSNIPSSELFPTSNNLDSLTLTEPSQTEQIQANNNLPKSHELSISTESTSDNILSTECSTSYSAPPTHPTTSFPPLLQSCNESQKLKTHLNKNVSLDKKTSIQNTTEMSSPPDSSTSSSSSSSSFSFKNKYAACVVNVGDSLAFVFSRRHGVREITTGSHDVTMERDIRDAGGALGPVREFNQPELNNLTCSMTLVDGGDVVFLATDGITDNFDPVVTKVALPKKTFNENENGDENKKLKVNYTKIEEEVKETMDNEEEVLDCREGKPLLLPFERHRYAIKEMERILHEFELFTECGCSAQELCGAILQHVLKLTDQKRKVLENPSLYGRRKKLSTEEKIKRDQLISKNLSSSPGKLDHATITGYEVGRYQGDEDEDYFSEECVDF